MKCTLWTILIASCVGLALTARAQAPTDRQTGLILDIRGDRRPAEAEKLTAVWLYPEDYVGQTVRLRGFLYEAENFEYFPDLGGYLFCCEALIYGRNNSYHAHVGNATFLSRESSISSAPRRTDDGSGSCSRSIKAKSPCRPRCCWKSTSGTACTSVTSFPSPQVARRNSTYDAKLLRLLKTERSLP